MPYNTGNPIPSSDAKDLSDNAENLDNSVNTALDTWTDRLGVVRRTIQGQLKLLGYTAPDIYAGGLVFTVADNMATIDRNGIVYAPLPSALPFTTSGTWTADDEDKFFVVQGLTTENLNEALEESDVVVLAANTVADMKTKDLQSGQFIRTKVNNTTSNAGGALYLIQTAAEFGGTPDEFVDHTLNNGNVAVYQVKNARINFKEAGGIAGLSALLQYAWPKKIAVYVNAGTYDVSSTILNLADNCSATLICESGIATFNYTGAETEYLIKCDDADDALFMNIKVQANNNINNPILIQKAVGASGVAGFFNVAVQDVKQTATTTSATGIAVSGGYKQVNLINCTTENVTVTNTTLAATGAVIIQFGGIATVKGCIFRNITTPGDADADGLKIFGTDVVTPTTFLGAIADVSNNVFEDCEGRWAKFQISDGKFYGNQLKLSTGFTTITNFTGVDFQSNNGNVFDNTIRIGSITFGADAKLFGFQSVRNDGGNKVSYCKNNRCTSGTNIEKFATCISEFGTTTFVLDDNEFSGASVNHYVQHRELNLANTDKINIYARNNKADGVVVNFYEPFDDIDFGDKLYLELVDNENFNGLFPSLYDQGKTAFACGGNFRFLNNSGFTERVNWEFDMNDLKKGNSFYTGAQVVANKGPNVASFFHVLSSGFVQRNIDTAGTNEDRRTSTTGTSWNTWVAV